jgi:hypothetical protein
MTRDQIEKTFVYHAPKDGQAAKYERIRAAGKEFALLLSELCPESRDLSVAHTKLQEVVMFANASIAINE